MRAPCTFLRTSGGGEAFPWVLGRLVGWIFHLVKRLTVCCFFCWRVRINLNRDLLWFGVSPRGVSVRTKITREGVRSCIYGQQQDNLSFWVFSNYKFSREVVNWQLLFTSMFMCIQAVWKLGRNPKLKSKDVFIVLIYTRINVNVCFYISYSLPKRAFIFNNYLLAKQKEME